jgi:hypothetical protein
MTTQEPKSDEADEVIVQSNDPFVVDWDGDDDPANPLNWPSRKKGLNILLLSCLTFVTYVEPPSTLESPRGNH